MSTLGTRCAICLELRCQLDRMSFSSPDLTQKETEHKKTPSLCERVLGGASVTLAGMPGDHSSSAKATTVTSPTRTGAAPHVAVGPQTSALSSSVPWDQLPWCPHPGSFPGPEGGAPALIHFPAISHPSQLHLKLPRRFFFWIEL